MLDANAPDATPAAWVAHGRTFGTLGRPGQREVDVFGIVPRGVRTVHVAVVSSQEASVPLTTSPLTSSVIDPGPVPVLGRAPAALDAPG